MVAGLHLLCEVLLLLLAADLGPGFYTIYQVFTQSDGGSASVPFTSAHGMTSAQLLAKGACFWSLL